MKTVVHSMCMWYGVGVYISFFLDLARHQADFELVQINLMISLMFDRT